MLTDNEALPKKISNDYFAAVGDLKTYVRPVSKIIPFEIFYTEKLKKKTYMQVNRKNKNRTHTLRRIFSLHTKSLNPSPYTVHSEVDFTELNVRKDEVDKAIVSPENATSYL